jgi:hypothetical protein
VTGFVIVSSCGGPTLTALALLHYSSRYRWLQFSRQGQRLAVVAMVWYIGVMSSVIVVVVSPLVRVVDFTSVILMSM